MAAPTHSHRPTTKVEHKAFKSRKATKGSLRDASKGRVLHEGGQRRSLQQQVLSKLDRKNQARQRQLEKQREHQKETSVFSGRDAAPRNVAVIPLCADGDALAAIRALNSSLDLDTPLQLPSFHISVPRFKQKLQYIPLERDLTACLDAAGAADFVVFVLSAEVEVDGLGELILRSVESQGLSSAFTVVQGLEKIESVKQRPPIIASLKSYIGHFLPGQEKLSSLDSRQDCANLMRSLCSTTPRGIHWRDERSWMFVERVQFPSSSDASTAIVTGVVRGRGLNADRLVHLGNWGTFQIDKITAAGADEGNPGKNDISVVVGGDEGSILAQPSEDQDDLDNLAPEEIVVEDMKDALPEPSDSPTEKKGVLLDNHHYFNDEYVTKEYLPPEKLPSGVSPYQASWYLKDVGSESGSDPDDEIMDDIGKDAEEDQTDKLDEDPMAEDTEAALSRYEQPEADEELSEEEDARQLAHYRAHKRDEAQDDKEYPDEIELQPDVLARERLARYRGLKDMRTSPWDEVEDGAHEPKDWKRLLRIQDYKSSSQKAAREAIIGGVKAGTRVHVHLRHVPVSIRSRHDSAKPLVLYALLRHEHKHTALNFLMNLSSDYEGSIKSKDEIIVQCGPRRFIVRPVFSQSGSTPNDVHKYCRYLHPGQSALASFVGPVTWGAVPALYFKRAADQSLNLIATGTALLPSTSRVVAKRVILTGHPYHIHKKIVTIRYMFFNKDDVDWFRALPLWTRRGKSGYIKESLGTHGYFKATFDGRINPQDSVAMSLYKRVWPRPSEPFQAADPAPEEVMDETA